MAPLADHQPGARAPAAPPRTRPPHLRGVPATDPSRGGRAARPPTPGRTPRSPAAPAEDRCAPAACAPCSAPAAALPRVPGGAGSRGRAPDGPALPTCEVRLARKMAAAAARAARPRPPPPGGPRDAARGASASHPPGCLWASERPSPSPCRSPGAWRRTLPNLTQLLGVDVKCELVP